MLIRTLFFRRCIIKSIIEISFQPFFSPLLNIDNTDRLSVNAFEGKFESRILWNERDLWTEWRKKLLSQHIVRDRYFFFEKSLLRSHKCFHYPHTIWESEENNFNKLYKSHLVMNNRQTLQAFENISSLGFALRSIVVVSRPMLNSSRLIYKRKQIRGCNCSRNWVQSNNIRHSIY